MMTMFGDYNRYLAGITCRDHVVPAKYRFSYYGRSDGVRYEVAFAIIQGCAPCFLSLSS